VVTDPQQHRRQLNQQVIEEFRANGGVPGGDFAGTPLLLLTTTGARTGELRTWPLVYRQDGDRYVVGAANGGRPAHPAWYHNVSAHPRVTVEVGTETFPATAVELTGPERDEQWASLVAVRPEFAAFQAGTSRRIPLIALTRASD
jgi:deazaflavin-dependent oxidoreductase (nitroreductase family)